MKPAAIKKVILSVYSGIWTDKIVVRKITI